MKELYTRNQWVLAIYDDKNYVLYDKTKPISKGDGKTTYKFSWFSQMHHAIRELSRRIANEECTNDLASWVKCLRAYHTELESLLTAGDAK